MAFNTFSSFSNQIGHYWMPLRLCSKNSNQLLVLNRLTDIFAVGKFDYDVMVRYQNLTWKPELFGALLGPGTMYPLNPPLAGPGCRTSFLDRKRRSQAQKSGIIRRAFQHVSVFKR